MSFRHGSKQRPNSKKEASMFMTTINVFPEAAILAVHGIVFGTSTASVGIKGAAGMVPKWVTGGNANGLQKSIEEIRDAALKNMCDAAAQKGANAVIGISCQIQAVFVEFTGAYCYGTAVTLVPPPPA
jgi:uncharacterized protein YbjQ (UPF0145 family)